MLEEGNERNKEKENNGNKEKNHHKCLVSILSNSILAIPKKLLFQD